MQTGSLGASHLHRGKTASSQFNGPGRSRAVLFSPAPFPALSPVLPVVGSGLAPSEEVRTVCGDPRKVEGRLQPACGTPPKVFRTFRPTGQAAGKLVPAWRRLSARLNKRAEASARCPRASADLRKASASCRNIPANWLRLAATLLNSSANQGRASTSRRTGFQVCKMEQSGRRSVPPLDSKSDYLGQARPDEAGKRLGILFASICFKATGSKRR